jgi:hypothetical protein
MRARGLAQITLQTVYLEKGVLIQLSVQLLLGQAMGQYLVLHLDAVILTTAKSCLGIQNFNVRHVNKIGSTLFKNILGTFRFSVV